MYHGPIWDSDGRYLHIGTQISYDFKGYANCLKSIYGFSKVHSESVSMENSFIASWHPVF